MPNALARRLGLSEKDLAKVHKTLGPIKGVVDFLADAARELERVHLPEAIAQAVPWLAFVGVLAPATPAVAFVLKLVAKIPGHPDPEALTYLAATIAYERSVEQAFAVVGEPHDRKQIDEDMKRALRALKPSEDVHFRTLSFASALEHPFVREADGFLDIFARAVGYEPSERRRLIGEVHGRFVVNLKTIVSHGALRDKLASVLERLRLGVGELAAFEALVEHADLQRRLFEEVPALGTEPFALADVYVDLDCGKLAWGDVASTRPPVDPFDEKIGGRHPLVETVLDLLGDPSFKDAIVVQGVAGAGKSAFTLRLASALLQEGLRPIRVRMRDLPFDRHAGDAIRRAVRLSDETEPDAQHLPAPQDLFVGGAIWNESLSFRRARICPYVLLLDGWDEISLSATEGFRARLERMLEEVRSEFLSNREVPVRVLLTGRPASALGDSSFLRDRTALLTMRPFSPDQLEAFVAKLGEAVKHPPITGAPRAKWGLDAKKFKPVLNRYRRDFAKGGHGTVPRGSMDVLGLPLLSHIAVRMMASFDGDLDQLLRSPTALYRGLVDLTCEHAGQFGKAALDPAARPRLTGDKLRALLRKTAAAISVHGAESISYLELSRRLRLDDKELASRADDAAENVLAALLVSFYFKGGRVDLGCEFLHKSFREYLYAEAIVDLLEQYAKKKHAELPRRGAYHQTFAASDARADLLLALGELLAPHWLGVDVAAHVDELHGWHVHRAANGGDADGRAYATLRGWEDARDALADLWDAWGDGVHLRPEPERVERGGFKLGRSLAERLVDWSLPQTATWGDPKLAPPRTSTMDAHLGDGLFRLTATLHGAIAIETGFIAGAAQKPRDTWQGASDPGVNARPCQVTVRRGAKAWFVFAPSNGDADYFANYVMRINAAGWRPAGPFPLGVRAACLDLRGATFTVPSPQVAPRPTLFAHSNAAGATLAGSTLAYVDLEGALLREAILDRADLFRASLHKADLEGASLVRADLSSALLVGANFTGADLEGANLTGVVVEPQDLLGAKVELVRR